MAGSVEVVPARVISELHELADLTSNDEGAQRVAWTATWARAREWLSAKLEEIEGVSVEQDSAGNMWASLGDGSARSVIIGGHLDSVPNGGWLDGCLNLIAGVEVLRHRASSLSSAGAPLQLVDWADEEGARFGGRSMFGSSMAAGTADPGQWEGVQDSDGVSFESATKPYGVDLERASQARERLNHALAYLELHIEQGPVLERNGEPLGVVTGTVGIRRRLVNLIGQAAHAGATPMDARHDALFVAANLIQWLRRQGLRDHGFTTIGQIDVTPNISTAVAGRCSLVTDQRHLDESTLERMVDAASEATRRFAEDEGVEVSWDDVWGIPPVPFDRELISLGRQAASEVTGSAPLLPSGTLHDAAQVARAGIPTVMLFVQSLGGISHAKEENTREEHLEMAVRALDRLTGLTFEHIGHVLR